MPFRQVDFLEKTTLLLVIVALLLLVHTGHQVVFTQSHLVFHPGPQLLSPDRQESQHSVLFQEGKSGQSVQEMEMTLRKVRLDEVLECEGSLVVFQQMGLALVDLLEQLYLVDVFHLVSVDDLLFLLTDQLVLDH